MLVILERSRILNHRATRESVGTLIAFLMLCKYTIYFCLWKVNKVGITVNPPQNSLTSLLLAPKLFLEITFYS